MLVNTVTTLKYWLKLDTLFISGITVRIRQVGAGEKRPIPTDRERRKSALKPNDFRRPKRIPTATKTTPIAPIPIAALEYSVL